MSPESGVVLDSFPHLCVSPLQPLTASDAEAAIDQLERMLQVSYIDALTVWDLRLDPIWDPLREHPRFQALVEEQE